MPNSKPDFEISSVQYDGQEWVVVDTNGNRRPLHTVKLPTQEDSSLNSRICNAQNDYFFKVANREPRFIDWLANEMPELYEEYKQDYIDRSNIAQEQKNAKRW